MDDLETEASETQIEESGENNESEDISSQTIEADVILEESSDLKNMDMTLLQ
eukprot:CAMPEP_0196581990 /NCGR_PEP_ID=MMETSP1081-20130531/36854_1 /TAXON_ID=36882 /ORGANISM="Pyramimonas amylifera, Strain CCMP720" /LENGTH=51 /DNA_ID=CAMNT_0041902427 /DNA_START=8 /DNA_END=160 /DNA_ORIENTATION=-